MSSEHSITTVPYSHLQTDRRIGMSNTLIQLIWNVVTCVLFLEQEISFTKGTFINVSRTWDSYTDFLNYSRGKLCFGRALPGRGRTEQAWEDPGSCSTSCPSSWVILCASFSLFGPWFLHLQCEEIRIEM